MPATGLVAASSALSYSLQAQRRCFPRRSTKKYDVGATDTEIGIGNITPYSGPASAFYDDGYSPPKTVEQARKLIEGGEVLLIFSPVGTPPNSAIHKYMNSKKVPQLFVATGATKWNDPKNFPWTMGWWPNYQSEAHYAKYLLKEKPNARIAVLYQNDDYGKDYLKGLKDGLGAKATSMIIAEESYETTEPSIDNHIVKLKYSGADVFFDVTSPKFATQAQIEWNPLHILNDVSANVGSVLQPAGFENSQGIISANYLKDASDPQWDNDPGMKQFYEFMAKEFPEGNKLDGSTVLGYGLSQTLVQVLKQCGDDLTRHNIMKQAANLNFRTEVLLPGVTINTRADDFGPINQLQLMRFKGEKWELFGDVTSGDVGDQLAKLPARNETITTVGGNAEVFFMNDEVDSLLTSICTAYGNMIGRHPCLRGIFGAILGPTLSEHLSKLSKDRTIRSGEPSVASTSAAPTAPVSMYSGSTRRGWSLVELAGGKWTTRERGQILSPMLPHRIIRNPQQSMSAMIGERVRQGDVPVGLSGSVMSIDEGRNA